MILFLDFDGVLHPDPCYDRRHLFRHAPALSEVLQRYEEVKVVLSTQWRTVYPLEKIAASLPITLRDRIVGINPIFGEIDAPAAWIPYPRQAECLHWLKENASPETEWVAIDDRPGWFEPYCERLIVCHPRIGLDEQALGQLDSRFNRARQRLSKTSELRG